MGRTWQRRKMNTSPNLKKQKWKPTFLGMESQIMKTNFQTSQLKNFDDTLCEVLFPTADQ